MTEELLRRWVRGEASPEERVEATRWIVRCTSPELGPLLRAYAREREEAEADRALLSRLPAWSALIERWSELLSAGAASWTRPDAGLALASIGVAPTASWCTLRERDDGVYLAVDAAPSLEVAAYLTADDGRVLRLVGPAPRDSVAWPVKVEGADGGRPTVWVVRGPSLPRNPDALAELLVASRQAEARALRWDAVEP